MELLDRKNKVHRLVLTTIENLKKDQFAFTVTINEKPFDVYHGYTPIYREQATIALRITEDEHIEVSLFANGHLPEDAVVKKLASQAN